jgi:hypothetical protein
LEVQLGHAMLVQLQIPLKFETFILQSDACFENQTLQLGDCSATAQSKGLSS